METKIESLLQRAVEANASDLHLKVGSPPAIRLDGTLERFDDLPPLTAADTEQYAEELFTDKARAEFGEQNEVDFAFGRRDLGRFRVSVFRQRGSVSLVLRRVVSGVPSLERLGLPPVVRKLAGETRGLVLFTGPSGSGRSTSIAAMVEHINATRKVSIITVEDPIEVLFPDQQASVAQREVGVDTADYAGAIKGAMRLDADVIVVSDVGDHATAAATIAAAETGHLVIGAMPTNDPADTIGRLIDLFPPATHRTVRTQLAGHLRGIISQRLITDAEGGGRVLATEVLTVNGRVQELILADAPIEEYLEVIKDSQFFGMQSFDQSLFSLVKAGRLSISVALPYVRNTHEFRAKAMEAGIES